MSRGRHFVLISRSSLEGDGSITDSFPDSDSTGPDHDKVLMLLKRLLCSASISGLIFFPGTSVGTVEAV